MEWQRFWSALNAFARCGSGITDQLLFPCLTAVRLLVVFPGLALTGCGTTASFACSARFLCFSEARCASSAKESTNVRLQTLQ